MKLCDVDEDSSLLSLNQSQDGIPPPDPLRLDWPKVIYQFSNISPSRPRLDLPSDQQERCSPCCGRLKVNTAFCSLQDRVLINRLDSLCTLVLSGHWPSGRRYVPEAQLHPTAELMGDEMAYTRMIRKPTAVPGGAGPDGEDGEFTVKLLKVKETLEV